jgi:hypothetical protein
MAMDQAETFEWLRQRSIQLDDVQAKLAAAEQQLAESVSREAALVERCVSIEHELTCEDGPECVHTAADGLAHFGNISDRARWLYDRAKRAEAAEKDAEALRGYARHKDGCCALARCGEPCGCGYAALLRREIRATVASPRFCGGMRDNR